MEPEVIRAGVAAGTIAVCCNINHKNLVPCGVGQGLAVKVNANIGTSSAYPDPEPELAKLRAAIDAGADSVMDLSTGDNIDASRKAIIAASTVMVGTVPIYQATVETIKKRGAVVEMTKEDLFEVIRQQAADGADFMTIHKPLLHLWSLGVEEQFYLVFPVFLYVIYRLNLNFVLSLTVNCI